MSDKSQNEDKKGSDWTPEKIESVLKGVLPLAEKYLSFKNNEAGNEVKYVEATSKHDRKVMFGLFGFLGVLIMALIWLTWSEKITGESLLFVIGLTIGYVFALIQRFIFGSQRTVAEETD
jgi:hypothetical protein